MKKISFWALHHPRLAQLSILMIYLLLSLLGFLIGSVLAAENIFISHVWIYLLTGFTLFCFITYPNKKNKNFYKNFYLRQKITDTLLGSCFLLLIISYANRDSLSTSVITTTTYALQPAPGEEIRKEMSIKNEKRSFFKRSVSKIKNFIAKAKNFYQSASNTGKGFLIALVVILAIFLLILLAALACNLACAGAGGVAAVVLILGTFGIIYLTVIVIKNIIRPNKNRPSDMEQ